MSHLKECSSERQLFLQHLQIIVLFTVKIKDRGEIEKNVTWSPSWMVPNTY